MASKTSSDVTNVSSTRIKSHLADDRSSDKEPVPTLVQPLAEHFASLADELNRSDLPNEARYGFETAVDEGQQRQSDADTATTRLWTASTARDPEGHRAGDTGPKLLLCNRTCIISQVAYPDNNDTPVVRKVRRVSSAPSALRSKIPTSIAQASHYPGICTNYASYMPCLSPRDCIAFSNLLHEAYRMDGSLPRLDTVLDYCPLCGRGSPQSGVKQAHDEGELQTHMSKVVSLRRPLPPLQPWSLRGIDSTSNAQGGLAQAEDLAEFHMIRSSLADPAITHTDIDQAAILPNSPITLPFGDKELYNTMSQVIESGKNVYKVVWDEANICGRPDGSSASSCGTDDPVSDDESNSAYTRRDSPRVGLDRVNTKLAAWSWKGAPHTVQEFDDDNDYECEGNRDKSRPRSNVPPNSERSSQVASRLPSRPPSDRVRFDTVLPTGSDSNEGVLSCQLGTLGSPDEDGHAQMVYRSVAGLEGAKIERRSRVFSNLPSMKTHFAGHRDSVAMARRRVRERACEPSAARTIPRSQNATGGMLSPIPDSSPPRNLY